MNNETILDFADEPRTNTPLIRLQPDRAAAALDLPATVTEQFPRPINRSRNGKIARLPRPERDMVNRMLFNNIPHHRIVAALDELNIKVTVRNISNWKTRGGYHEWCLAQERALTTRLRLDHLTDLLRRHRASDISEVGLQAAAEQLSQFFITPEAAQLLATDPREYHRRLAMLNQLAARLKSLQQYRDNRAKDINRDPDWSSCKAEEKIERLRQTYSSTEPQNANIPAIPHRNYLHKP
jgi:hypothetical protein